MADTKYRIYISGKDGMGWAIDEYRNNIAHSLKRQHCHINTIPFTADIIHNLWWNNILSSYLGRFLLQHHPRVIVTASNFIDPNSSSFFLNKEFELVSKKAKAWIAFGSKQKRILEDLGCLCFQMPNYVDTSLFHPLPKHISKEVLMEKYGIPKDIIKDRIIIGSFQRDSLGSDLSKPKWQKGPDYLSNLLEKLPKDKYILLLASPRRHYIINECEKKGIPYYYLGTRTQTDDIQINNMPLQVIRDLYWLCDLYLITSASEGGPNAIMETTLTNTPVFSTDVGMVKDFLPSEQIFTSEKDYLYALNEYLVNPHFRQQIQKNTMMNYMHANQILGYDSMDQQLIAIYTELMNL